MQDNKGINKVIELENNDILPNRFQPRKYFDEEEILQLSESIKEHGVLNPIIVRRLGDKYELVAGERRYKANILAGNDKIPAIVMDVNDKESSEIAVVENIQRKDLNAIEEAISYKRILDIGYMTQEQLARKMGKSQSSIANKIRLLKLSDEVQDALMKKQISERHARSLLRLESISKQNELLKRIIDERLTVRKTDEEIEKMNNNINANILNNEYSQDNNTNNYINNNINANNNINNNNMENNLNNNNIDNIYSQNINGFNQNMQMNNQINRNITNFNSDQNQQSTITNFNDVILTKDEKIPEVPSTNPIEENITPIMPDKSVPEVDLSTFQEENNTDLNTINNDIFKNNSQIPVSDFNLDNQVVMQDNINSNFISLDDSTKNPVNDNVNINNVNNIKLDLDSNIASHNLNDNIFIKPQSDIVENDKNNNNNIKINENEYNNNQSNMFKSSPIIDTTNNNQENQNNNYQSEVKPEPIIVNDYNQQYDPIMPEKENINPTIDFKSIINLIRKCSAAIENSGYKIETEEYNLDNLYQVIFKIEKQ